MTYCGDYFTMYTNVKSLDSTPEINIILYVNYTSIKKINWSFMNGFISVFSVLCNFIIPNYTDYYSFA